VDLDIPSACQRDDKKRHPYNNQEFYRKEKEKIKMKNKKLLPNIDTANQTPIEISLGIDEDGNTTATKLYSFLELNPSNYSKWYKTNILENELAEENIDYFPFVLEYESVAGMKERQDYKLTAKFAKKLSMTQKNEKGEQARNYFLACEQGLKMATKKLQKESSGVNTEKLAEVFSSTLKPMTEAMTSISDRLSKIEEQQSQPKLPKKRYSRWTSKTFDKLNSILKYINANSSEQLTLPNIIHMMIRETEDTYDIEVADYVSMYECEFQVDKPYPLTAIEHYKEVRDMFTFTLDSKLEGLGIQEEKPMHKRTIIDELIERRKLNLENKTNNIEKEPKKIRADV